MSYQILLKNRLPKCPSQKSPGLTNRRLQLLSATAVAFPLFAIHTNYEQEANLSDDLLLLNDEKVTGKGFERLQRWWRERQNNKPLSALETAQLQQVRQLKAPIDQSLILMKFLKRGKLAEVAAIVRDQPNSISLFRGKEHAFAHTAVQILKHKKVWTSDDVLDAFTLVLNAPAEEWILPLMATPIEETQKAIAYLNEKCPLEEMGLLSELVSNLTKIAFP